MSTKYQNLKEIGVWVDDNFKHIDQSYVNELKECNINSVSLMVNKSNVSKSDDGWVLRFPKEEFKRVTDLMHQNNIDVTLTCWPRPDKEQIDQMICDMDILIHDCAAKTFEIDAEANWLPTHLKGFKDLAEAASYLVQEMKKVKTNHNCLLALTTYPYHSENSSKALISPHLDLIFSQAYSVVHRANNVMISSQDQQLGPGYLQEISINRSKETKCPKIGLGLAAYDQKFNGHSEQQSMKKTLDKAIDMGIENIKWWSSKWIIGISENKYAKKFLKELK